MAVEIGRRSVVIGLSAALGASAFPLTGLAAEKSYLVRGPKGEYYFFSGSELKALAHKGACKFTDCVAVAPAEVVIKKSDIAKFELSSSELLARHVSDKELISALDTSIKKRQALGSKISAKLIAQGFSVGTLDPTKVG